MQRSTRCFVDILYVVVCRFNLRYHFVTSEALKQMCHLFHLFSLGNVCSGVQHCVIFELVISSLFHSLLYTVLRTMNVQTYEHCAVRSRLQNT